MQDSPGTWKMRPSDSWLRVGMKLLSRYSIFDRGQNSLRRMLKGSSA
jgi:hypothetical protein